MNKIYECTLKGLRLLSLRMGISKDIPLFHPEEDPDIVSKWISDLLNSDSPCMIARYGSTEMTAIVNYLGVKSGDHNPVHYITGKSQQWWWNKDTLMQMSKWSGFFPSTEENIAHFCEIMLEDSKQVDLLGSWTKGEYLLKELHPNVKRVHIGMLDPYWATNPWTKCLENKRILVIHPFAETILSQYNKRSLLFSNKQVLPEFKELKVIKAVQTLGGQSEDFKDWFEALEYMKKEIDHTDFDVCLIGCGAYGFPLAAHVKRKGKKAVHIGGSLQLLFGIMGNRWNHDVPHDWHGHTVHYAGLQNEFWVRPDKKDNPKNAQDVEGACYW